MSRPMAPEELHRLSASLREFVEYQRRLGLQWVEGTLPPPPAAPAPPVLARPTKPAAAPEPLSTLSLDEIRQVLGDCRRCKLWKTRTHLVFGIGNPQARLMFIGEAPGAEEDQQGEPFVGAAGQLLNRLLEKLGLARAEVYITNVAKCRPPNNRNPDAEEIAACRPFLIQQIQAIRPEVIVTLGAVATHALLAAKAPLNRLRGQWQQFQGIPVMPTFHPSYLLRVPQDRIKTWEDMQKVLARLREDSS
ncbi:MAG: uracil-DNA glycosylase [Desulfobacca sp.]|uniref:uracil-DNA glycosylase n=1 Tax=Desulfobacca sp. TaxID=2067990 RepID=UPI004049FEFC